MHERHSLFYIVRLVSAAVFIAVPLEGAQSAIFEQTETGKIIEVRGGALVGAPPPVDGNAEAPAPVSHSHYSFGATGEGPATPATVEPTRLAVATAPGPLVTASAVVDITTSLALDFTDVPIGDGVAVPPLSLAPAATASIGATMQRLGQYKLPHPRKMGEKLSPKQREMYELALRVGKRFAASKGVRKAKLSEALFVRLFATMIQRESNFNRRAVSSAGAKGLGQLMPGTARSLGVSNAFNAEENLVASATYLTRMLERFGKPELALAAYNAGPGAVRKHGGIPPYRETRQYVADILHAVNRRTRGADTELAVAQ